MNSNCARRVRCRIRRFLYAICRVAWRSSRPPSNWQNSRLAVSDFAPDELLAFRFYRNNIDANGQLTSAAMVPPDQSMNRLGLDGKHWFVLLPDPGQSRDRMRARLCMGILTIAVKDLPVEKQYEEHRYTFRIEHDPLSHNYQHCELRLYRDGIRVIPKKKKLGIGGDAETEVKKYYREVLADRVSIYLYSEVSSKDAK